MSCENCHSSGVGLNIELEKVINEATAYAKEKNIPVAIYKEAGEYKYCDAFFAYGNGYQVTRVVSIHRKIAAM